MLRYTLGALCLVPLVAHAQADRPTRDCDGATTLNASQIDQRVVEKPRPEYPRFALAAGIEGIVHVEACVSINGSVLEAKPVDGNPVLVPSAIQSVQRWRFKPGGEVVRAVLEVAFPEGLTPAEAAEQAATVSRFSEKQTQCRATLQRKELDAAVERCAAAAELADKLPEGRSINRILAYQDAGRAEFEKSNFQMALVYHQAELQVALERLNSDAAELAYAYRDVAVASHALRHTGEAGLNYSKAEQTLLRARDHITNEDLKQRYSATLKELRGYYMILLQQTGQTETAAALAKRMGSDEREGTPESKKPGQRTLPRFHFSRRRHNGA